MGLPENYDYENSTMRAEIDIAGADSIYSI